MRRLFSTSSHDFTKSIKKHWYNHIVPDNALKSKITHDAILSDKFGRYHNYLRISLTEKCNMNCRYCVYDQDIKYTAKDKLLSEDEMLRMTRLFVKAGVTKIRLTGGEPTIYKGLSKFIYEIGSMDEIKTLAMTTNGSVLYKKLNEYHKNGLTNLNISLDTFDAKKAEYVTRTKFHKNVLRSIEDALSIGYNPLKINCVVMRGINDDEIENFVEYVRDKPINVRFIEFFSIGSNGWTKDKTFSFKEMVDKIEKKFGPLKRLDDHYTETAKNYSLDGFMGTISFITSVTTPFCGSCNRIRLLSSGDFRRCLHDDNMLNMKELIKRGYNDDFLLEAISMHLKNKKKAHGGMDFISKMMKDGIEMIKIGG